MTAKAASGAIREPAASTDDEAVADTWGEAAAGASGSWDVEIASSYGNLPAVFHIAQSGSSITGTVEGSMFETMPIEGGSIDGNRAEWKVSATQPMPMTLEFAVTFEGDSVSGAAQFGEFGDGKVSGTRRARTEGGAVQSTDSMPGGIPVEPRRTTTVPPREITPELRPVVEELGLVENCRQLAEEGWTIVENAADPAFVARLRQTILETTDLDDAGNGNAYSVLAKDPAYAEAVLNPKVMALAEFSVGRGFLLGSLVATVRAGGSPALPVHVDEGMFPAPLPEHNMMLTACWACDDFTQEGGATLVVPGTLPLMRHPTDEESAAAVEGAIAMECPAGSVVLWDGRVWHGNWPRTIDGQRVVLHATYYRVLLRQGDNYSDEAEELIERYGTAMSQLLGEEDYFYKKNFDYVKDYAKFVRTMNNAKS